MLWYLFVLVVLLVCGVKREALAPARSVVVLFESVNRGASQVMVADADGEATYEEVLVVHAVPCALLYVWLVV